ncbi:anthranilate phosphoribosyltransferase [Elizabethkingia miricola]|uniref:Anthranilate phosphoribosyltransferase n=1 Tax=Elizabethkingia miricola TaxID=172045 RepID=A0ABY3NMK1_ELIMR|nr:anthranilate phosphoribosyltransferase [Elizabethkingia miricola]OBS12312.1 anthranilate phosphoribosyltransferase [Elizabethkingia miricola]TYO94251.1 anthranilate phosphoribosyltransferase [Elizabethkingia miricola]
MKQILQYLFDHHTLSRAEAKAILSEIAQNKYNENEVTAFVSVFLMRNITLAELEGFQEALLQLAVPADLGTNDLVDIVGTGGDGKNTFNISTLASFIVAGTGQKVAKHGNYGVSSTSGASNVLEELGYQFKNNAEDLKKDLEKANICFIHAPLFHPALKAVGPLRKNLGLRTFFNILGPLVNPSKPKYSMIGVYNPEIARIYQYLLQKQKEKFMLVHALDGYDEISLTQDTKIYSEKGEEIYSAEDLHFKTITADSIFGGISKQEAAEIFLNILKGNGSYEQNAVVLANAAMALKNTGKYGDYDSCLTLSRESLESGKAFRSLQLLVKS